MLRICSAIIQLFFDCTMFLFKRKFIFAWQLSKLMLQRIQTVYLGLALIISGVLPFFFPLWTESGKDFMFNQSIVYNALFGASAVLSLISIISFKKRQQQFAMGRLNMILNLILLGLFVYHSLNLSGDAKASEKGIGMFLPVLSIVMLVLANKAIKKDEDRVKSVDRLR